MLVAGEIIFCRIKTVQAIRGADPQYFVPVFIYIPNIIITNAVAVFEVIPVNHHLVTVIPVQAVTCAKPDKSPAILANAFNGAAG